MQAAADCPLTPLDGVVQIREAIHGPNPLFYYENPGPPPFEFLCHPVFQKLPDGSVKFHWHSKGASDWLKESTELSFCSHKTIKLMCEDSSNEYWWHATEDFSTPTFTEKVLYNDLIWGPDQTVCHMDVDGNVSSFCSVREAEMLDDELDVFQITKMCVEPSRRAWWIESQGQPDFWENQVLVERSMAGATRANLVVFYQESPSSERIMYKTIKDAALDARHGLSKGDIVRRLNSNHHKEWWRADQTNPNVDGQQIQNFNGNRALSLASIKYAMLLQRESCEPCPCKNRHGPCWKQSCDRLQYYRSIAESHGWGSITKVLELEHWNRVGKAFFRCFNEDGGMYCDGSISGMSTTQRMLANIFVCLVTICCKECAAIKTDHMNDTMALLAYLRYSSEEFNAMLKLVLPFLKDDVLAELPHAATLENFSVFKGYFRIESVDFEKIEANERFKAFKASLLKSCNEANMRLQEEPNKNSTESSALVSPVAPVTVATAPSTVGDTTMADATTEADTTMAEPKTVDE